MDYLYVNCLWQNYTWICCTLFTMTKLKIKLFSSVYMLSVLSRVVCASTLCQIVVRINFLRWYAMACSSSHYYEVQCIRIPCHRWYCLIWWFILDTLTIATYLWSNHLYSDKEKICNIKKLCKIWIITGMVAMFWGYFASITNAFYWNLIHISLNMFAFIPIYAHKMLDLMPDMNNERNECKTFLLFFYTNHKLK